CARSQPVAWFAYW
nr:immunoglobulin heavy chain junction region [Mus musculus]